MSIRETRMYPVQVEQICTCGGSFKSMGNGVTTGWTATWQHQCDRCYVVTSFPQIYPTIEYRKEQP